MRNLLLIFKQKLLDFFQKLNLNYEIGFEFETMIMIYILDAQGNKPISIKFEILQDDAFLFYEGYGEEFNVELNEENFARMLVFLEKAIRNGYSIALNTIDGETVYAFEFMAEKAMTTKELREFVIAQLQKGTEELQLNAYRISYRCFDGSVKKNILISD